MAFPLPDHLPRKQDVSSAILTKIGNATNSSLDASVAGQWVTELDETILTTKRQIHDRILSNLPDFERQFSSSVSVQERLVSLKHNVLTLDEAITEPGTGLVDSLVGKLAAHAKLSQKKTDAQSTQEALDHVLRARDEYHALATLVAQGQLPAAVNSIHHLAEIIAALPPHINRAKVIVEIQRKFAATRARAEDQLDNAYSRAIVISHSELIIRRDIPVRQSEESITFPEIISSFSSASLTQKLAVLRRDLIGSINYIATQPLTIPPQTSSLAEEKLILLPAPPTPNEAGARLTNLSLALDFLSSHLFQHLPSSFPSTLSKSLTTNLLNDILLPALPSSFDLLPSYLRLTQNVVAFEERYVVKLLGNDPLDTPLKEWVSGVGGHYERQRRTHILAEARQTFVRSSGDDDSEPSFMAELAAPTPIPTTATVIPVQYDDDDGHEQPEVEHDDDAWGLEEDSPHTQGSDDTEAWGLVDDLEDSTPNVPKETLSSPQPLPPRTEPDPDPDDAWGWNDDEAEVPADDDPWSDPWDEGPQSESLDRNTSPAKASVGPTVAPKVAKRLEKLALKGKKRQSTSSVTSPTLIHPPSPPARTHSPLPRPSPELHVRPPRLHPREPVPMLETYRVSGKMQKLLNTVHAVLEDAEQVSSEGPKLFSSSASASVPGTTLYQTASSVLDLYRAIHPVRGGEPSIQSPQLGLQYSNDLLWLSEQVDKVRFEDEKRRLSAVSERSFEDAINRQRVELQQLLSNGSRGLGATGDQDRYDECEEAVTNTVQQIKKCSVQWKNLLAKGRYYTALGLIADAALSQVLGDILDLQDIPELESHRLSELCRIFNSLEGLFIEDAEQPSFVVSYVPSWLKFSYLSELLEASMADITYLFEEGALVDFETDELVRLVKALFADNALRTTTINKIMEGHPA